MAAVFDFLMGFWDEKKETKTTICQRDYEKNVLGKSLFSLSKTMLLEVRRLQKPAKLQKKRAQNDDRNFDADFSDFWPMSLPKTSV